MKMTSILICLIIAMISATVIGMFSPVATAYAETAVDADYSIIEEAEPEVQYSKQLHMPDTSNLIAGIPYLINSDERTIIMEAVYASAGNQDYHTMVLVAQSIRDGTEENKCSPEQYISIAAIPVMKVGRYSNCRQNVEDSVDVVFNMGYRATAEKTDCWYNPDNGISEWHESLHFVVESGNLRFFCSFA